MLFSIVALVLLACVEFGSCLTCFHCHGHDPNACVPIVCDEDEACKLHSNHRRKVHLHVTLPAGCQNSSECEPSNCCHDDGCVKGVMASAHAPYITPTVQSTTTYSQACNDEVVSIMTNCHALASSGACLDSFGVHVCKRTCGFCDYVTSRFGDQGYCRDTLLNDQCAKQNICADAFAIELCPLTCGLCDVKLQNVMKDFLNRTTTTAGTTMTTTTTTTTSPCVDTIENNGCASMPNICNDEIAPIVCQRFCNRCDSTGAPSSGNNFALSVGTSVPTTLSPVSKHVIPKQQCVDQLGNDGCALLPPGICQQSVASTMCPKFCNLCV